MYYVQLSTAVRRSLRQLNDAMCMEQRLPKVDEQGRARSANRRHVLRMTCEKLLCLTRIISRRFVTSTSQCRSAISLTFHHHHLYSSYLFNTKAVIENCGQDKLGNSTCNCPKNRHKSIKTIKHKNN